MRTIITAAALILLPSLSPGSSVLSGLELADNDRGQGVEIVGVDPASPAARAKLETGDCITSIGGFSVKDLDNYVKISSLIGKRRKKATIVYYRKGVRHITELSLSSAVLRDQWGVTIIPWREMDSSEEKSRPDYWLDQARREEEETARKGEKDRTPADYGKTLLSLFTALHLDPDSTGTAILAARRYGELAAFYGERSREDKSLWCLKQAAQLYERCLKKAGNVQELALVKKGLEDFQKTMAGMKR